MSEMSCHVTADREVPIQPGLGQKVRGLGQPPVEADGLGMGLRDKR